jgi:predicted RNA-binding Zn-ribbon protein involved in translation (DUF1610 family)
MRRGAWLLIPKWHLRIHGVLAFTVFGVLVFQLIRARVIYNQNGSDAAIASLEPPRWLNWLMLGFGLATVLLWIENSYLERRMRQRLAAGLCPACGYDLRASRDRCPECGHAIIPRSEAANDP